jgi:hypothetical protein
MLVLILAIIAEAILIVYLGIKYIVLQKDVKGLVEVSCSGLCYGIQANNMTDILVGEGTTCFAKCKSWFVNRLTPRDVKIIWN